MNARFVETSASFRPDHQPPVAAVITAPTGAIANVQAPIRHVHRQRDFGIGYGNSSGYASSKRYTNDWGLTRFRCA